MEFFRAGTVTALAEARRVAIGGGAVKTSRTRPIRGEHNDFKAEPERSRFVILSARVVGFTSRRRNPGKEA